MARSRFSLVHIASFEARLKKLAGTTTAKQRETIQACLADEDCVAAAFFATRRRWKQRRGNLSADGRPVIDFLAWLLDHADEIIAVVAKIVALFAKLA